MRATIAQDEDKMDNTRLKKLAGVSSDDDQLILIPGYGRLTVGQARQKLDEYLKELARSSDLAKDDPAMYNRIGAIFRNGVVTAIAETLSRHFQDRWFDQHILLCLTPMSIADHCPVGMSGCDRNGIAGNCGSENCDTLMVGDCPIQDELDPRLLYELGVIDIMPEQVQKTSTHEDDYDRAMSIL